jgi:hypothetical protein
VITELVAGGGVVAGTGAAVGAGAAGGAGGGGGGAVVAGKVDVVVVVVVVVVVAGRVVVVVVVAGWVVGTTAGSCTGSIGDGAAGTVATRARPNRAEAAIASSEAITRSAGLRRTTRQYGEGGGQIGEGNVRVLSSQRPNPSVDASDRAPARERLSGSPSASGGTRRASRARWLWKQAVCGPGAAIEPNFGAEASETTGSTPQTRAMRSATPSTASAAAFQGPPTCRSTRSSVQLWKGSGNDRLTALLGFFTLCSIDVPARACQSGRGLMSCAPGR